MVLITGSGWWGGVVQGMQDGCSGQEVGGAVVQGMQDGAQDSRKHVLMETDACDGQHTVDVGACHRCLPNLVPFSIVHVHLCINPIYIHKLYFSHIYKSLSGSRSLVRIDNNSLKLCYALELSVCSKVVT